MDTSKIKFYIIGFIVVLTLIFFGLNYMLKKFTDLFPKIENQPIEENGYFVIDPFLLFGISTLISLFVFLLFQKK